MVNYNPLLMIDFYKGTHAEQYPKDMELIYSPYTPRMTRLKDTGLLYLQGYLLERVLQFQLRL